MDEPYRRGVQLTEAQADALLRKDLSKLCALYSKKSSVLKKLKAGERDIAKAYASHCRYKGKWHTGLYTRRLTELAALFIP